MGIARLLVAVAVALLFIPASALAIPILQLYVQGATYDTTTDTWATDGNPIVLSVAGAGSLTGVDHIENIQLNIAIPSTDVPPSVAPPIVSPPEPPAVVPTPPPLTRRQQRAAAMAAQRAQRAAAMAARRAAAARQAGNSSHRQWKRFGVGAPSPTSVDQTQAVQLDLPVHAEDLGPSTFIQIDSALGETTNIHEILGSGGLPPMSTNGSDSAEHWSISLPDLLVSTAGETVYDYTPGSSSTDTGDVQYYTVSYGNVPFIHFDLQGTAVIVTNSGQRFEAVFAPFSPGAEALVPEPATLLLVGGGLVGLAAKVARRRKQRKRSPRRRES